MAYEAFVVPSEIELVEFFGTEPIEKAVEEGFWCYVATDFRGVRLRFSFNLFEQSVQTTLEIEGSPLITVVEEGALAMQIKGRQLTCSFSGADRSTTMTMSIEGTISLDWVSLRTA